MLRKLPAEKQHDWIAAYEFWHGGAFPPMNYITQFDRLKQSAGLTDELIVAVMEEGLRRKRDFVVKWTESVVVSLVPYGVTTPAEWEQHKAEKVEEDKRLVQERAQEKADQQAAAQDGAQSKAKLQQKPKASNVFLQREKMQNYDHVFKKFDE